MYAGAALGLSMRSMALAHSMAESMAGILASTPPTHITCAAIGHSEPREKSYIFTLYVS